MKLLANMFSWFTFYCITRTLSNSVEACLTPVILYYWMAAYEAESITGMRKLVQPKQFSKYSMGDSEAQ